MLVSSLGARWKDVYVPFFTVFVDDSGTDPNQKVAIATCFIVPANRIPALESEWNLLKAKEEFACFHTAEFSARNHKSEFATWDKTKHDRVFSRVCSIVKKFGVRVFSFAVNKKDYDEIIPAQFRTYLHDHYSWAIYYAIRLCARWRSEKQIANPFEWIFDYMKPSDPKRKEIEQVMEMAEDKAASNGRPGEYKNFTFRERCDLPGLQCVDVLAWTCYQIALHGFEKKDYYPDAEIAAKDFDEYMDSTWMDCITVRRDDLEAFVTRELAIDPELEAFEAWFTKTGKKPVFSK